MFFVEQLLEIYQVSPNQYVLVIKGPDGITQNVEASGVLKSVIKRLSEFLPDLDSDASGMAIEKIEIAVEKIERAD